MIKQYNLKAIISEIIKYIVVSRRFEMTKIITSFEGMKMKLYHILSEGALYSLREVFGFLGFRGLYEKLVYF
jgi:hypothetical protein